MNNNPTNPGGAIQARLLELAKRCLQGELNPGALAREAFTLGLTIGRAECRQRHGERNEGGDHERH